MRRARGFTLLELLVAIGIFAVVSAIAYGTLTRLLRDRDHVQQEQAFWRTLSLTFARLSDDLAQARNRPVRDVTGETLPALSGQPTDTRPGALPSLELTRGGAPVLADGPRDDLQRVAYRLTDNGVLERWVWPVLDRAPSTQPVKVPLLKHVERFQVRFYSPHTGWVDEWPVPGDNEPLPRGVEIKLRLTGRGEFTRLFLVNG